MDRVYNFVSTSDNHCLATVGFKRTLNQEAGVEIDPLGDLNTESERKLDQLVLENDDPAYSNSFDVFIRGEEIISGAQRVHVPEFLATRAEACGIDVKTISTYIDSFGCGAPLHGGFGVGLERVVMLFCALNNIRKTSLFPRDPLRIAP
ncbi:Aspartate--tRNA ligase 2, cytoplasmic [Camellia lanceoleosa]|uniref:Aspartate--tRNA ligase 2, cytoplasmic n=1 Tax=Camellia lanceoleosa TaxID=1840588 RepID=A0ACC0I712_9ERIC|nr:Aspartate--tRNA ligase 2, cytoplasmic [Camellia lanceoleosa]